MQPCMQATGKLGLGRFAFTSLLVTLCVLQMIFKVGGAQSQRLFLEIDKATGNSCMGHSCEV